MEGPSKDDLGRGFAWDEKELGGRAKERRACNKKKWLGGDPESAFLPYVGHYFRDAKAAIKALWSGL